VAQALQISLVGRSVGRLAAGDATDISQNDVIEPLDTFAPAFRSFQAPRGGSEPHFLARITGPGESLLPVRCRVR